MNKDIYASLKATAFTSPLGEELIILPREQLEKLIEQASQPNEEIDIDGILAFFTEIDLAHENQVFTLPENNAHRLKAARKARGLNQQQLASLTGLSQSLISSLESKTNEGTVESWVKLANVLDVSLDFLLR